MPSYHPNSAIKDETVAGNTANCTIQTTQARKHFVVREFDDFLRCGRLENGFLRVVCGDCKHEKLVAFSCKRRGFYSGLPALRPSGQPSVVQKTLAHLDKAFLNSEPVLQLPPLRASPDQQHDAYIVQRDFNFGAKHSLTGY